MSCSVNLPFLRPILSRQINIARGPVCLRFSLSSQAPRKNTGQDPGTLTNGDLAAESDQSPSTNASSDLITNTRNTSPDPVINRSSYASTELPDSTLRFRRGKKRQNADDALHHETVIRQIQETGRYKGLKLEGPEIARVIKLIECGALQYRSQLSETRSPSCKEFLQLDLGQSPRRYTIAGRVHSIRRSGNRLSFIDIVQDGHKVQVVCNNNESACESSQTPEEYALLHRHLSRGDIISAHGIPSRGRDGLNQMIAKRIPIVLTPNISPLPTSVEDLQTRMNNRHVDMLVNTRAAQTIRLRSHIIQIVRQFLSSLGFLEVQTPILAASAGGATAKPFKTQATEFRGRDLALRIAPELWLKRLIVGGFDSVFEIGQVFRNEGIDLTHNPEFTTCEFYKSFANLDWLKQTTAEMMDRLFFSSRELDWKVNLEAYNFERPYKEIDFITEVEEGLGQPLPPLHLPNATQMVLEMFERHGLPLPTYKTLPSLLDKLCAIYIEPRCMNPTFITNHPACMSPLATSRCHQQQFVSNRAELFINHYEMANMYEEQNSPFEQRTAFLMQQRHQGTGPVALDGDYLAALLHGMPPTAGWGCGIDRLVMLFAGVDRISDVQPFGNLRNVVALASQNTHHNVDPADALVFHEAAHDGVQRLKARRT